MHRSKLYEIKVPIRSFNGLRRQRQSLLKIRIEPAGLLQQATKGGIWKYQDLVKESIWKYQDLAKESIWKYQDLAKESIWKYQDLAKESIWKYQDLAKESART